MPGFTRPCSFIESFHQPVPVDDRRNVGLRVYENRAEPWKVVRIAVEEKNAGQACDCHPYLIGDRQTSTALKGLLLQKDIDVSMQFIAQILGYDAIQGNIAIEYSDPIVGEGLGMKRSASSQSKMAQQEPDDNDA